MLGDAEKDLQGWVRPTGIPNVNMIGDDMRLMTYDDRGLEDAFDWLAEELAE